MAEKVAKLGVKREKDFMYYIKDGAVWKVPRKQPGMPKGKPEKVADAGVNQDTNYIYFLDKDGDVARAKRAVGGQKRKKTAGKRQEGGQEGRQEGRQAGEEGRQEGRQAGQKSRQEKEEVTAALSALPPRALASPLHPIDRPV